VGAEAAGGAVRADGPFVNGADRYRTALAVAGLLGAAGAVGAIERALSLQHSPFPAAVGGMTAPWLLLPFLIGVFCPRREGTALLGLACVWLAIGAYSAGAETGGDFGGHLTAARFVSYCMAFGLSHLPALLGAAVSGPVYARLGHGWRVSRSWLPALAVTAPVMLEPGLRSLASQSILFSAGYPPVAWAEALTGTALTAAAVADSVRSGGARSWPGRTRRNESRGLLAGLVRRAAAIAGTAAVAVAAVVFCAPPVFAQVYPAGNGTVGVVVTPDGRTAYVGNYGYVDDGAGAGFPSVPPTVTPVDLATMRAGRPIEVAPSGWSIADGLVSSDGRTFYAVVDDNSTSWVSSVNLRTGARTRIVVPGGADAIALSPGGRTLYVSDYDNAIVPVATATGQAGRPLPVPSGPDSDLTPDHLAVAADGETIYVGLTGQSDAEVTGIDIATGRTLPWAYSSDGLGSLLLAPDGRTLYLSVPGGSDDEYAVSGGSRLVAISTATGRQAGEPLPLSDDPVGLTATPDGRNLLIIGQGSVTETRLSPDGGPARPVTLPRWGQPNTGFAMSPDGSILYVSVADGSDPGGLSFVRLLAGRGLRLARVGGEHERVASGRQPQLRSREPDLRVLAVQHVPEAVSGGVERSAAANAAVARAGHVGHGEPVGRPMPGPVEERAPVVALHRVQVVGGEPGVVGYRDRDRAARVPHLGQLPARAGQGVVVGGDVDRGGGGGCPGRRDGRAGRAGRVGCVGQVGRVGGVGRLRAGAAGRQGEQARQRDQNRVTGAGAQAPRRMRVWVPRVQF
jgi:DNA-binding beta-propeller fold protein YncE